jgi:hypothetical protein
MGHDSSLLRQVRRAALCAVLLTLAAGAGATTTAAAPTPVPDPSPLGGLAGPDPYPARTPTPSGVVVAPVHVITVLERTAPVTQARPRVHDKASGARRKAAKPTQRSAAAKTTPIAPASAPARLLDLRSPLATLERSTGEVRQRVSRTLALTLGLLVLLSTTLVAAAARELAR